MIRQEITYYPNTFQPKEYKEYQDGVLNVHTKYDENNNKVYMFLAYSNEEIVRKYEEGATNSNGRLVYYKDNRGNLIDELGDLKYGITTYKNNTFEAKIKNALHETILHAKGYRNNYLESMFFQEVLPNGDVLSYNRNYFDEIYYEYKSNDYSKRKIISFDELMEITQHKDFLIKYKIVPVSGRYLAHTIRKKTAQSLYM